MTPIPRLLIELFGSAPAPARSAPRACGLTTYPAMSGSRHLRRVVPPSWSNTPPPADHREVVGARLGHPGLDVGERRVLLVDLDLAAVDATAGVAPRREHVSGVEELLVEARAAGEAGVGEGRDLDVGRRDALLGGLVGLTGRRRPTDRFLHGAEGPLDLGRAEHRGRRLGLRRRVGTSASRRRPSRPRPPGSPPRGQPPPKRPSTCGRAGAELRAPPCDPPGFLDTRPKQEHVPTRIDRAVQADIGPGGQVADLTAPCDQVALEHQMKGIVAGVALDARSAPTQTAEPGCAGRAGPTGCRVGEVELDALGPAERVAAVDWARPVRPGRGQPAPLAVVVAFDLIAGGWAAGRRCSSPPGPR